MTATSPTTRTTTSAAGGPDGTTRSTPRAASQLAGASLLAMAALAGGAMAVGGSAPAVWLFGAVIALDVVVSLALYPVFRGRAPRAAAAAAALRLAYSAAFAAVLAPVAWSYATSGDADAAWDRFHPAWTTSMAVFGLHLLVVAWILFRYGRVAGVIAALLAVAGVCYVFDPALGTLDADTARSALEPVLVLSAAVGEVALAVWLLGRGGRDLTGTARVPRRRGAGAADRWGRAR